MRARAPGIGDRAVVWHDVECASYAADLPLWEELAERAAGPILELGCGSGRVALHLARLGHEVLGVDTEPALVAALNARAEQARLPAGAIVAGAASFELERRFALALAPMQLVQILGGESARRAMLSRVAAHLDPGGILAAAVVESRHLPESAWSAHEDDSPPLPDVREQDGWVFSSQPLALEVEGARVSVQRLRQAVSPLGELSEVVDITELDPLTPSQLAAEASDAGLRDTGTREVVATEWHVGSTVVLLEGP
jgi:SAM-dependent methyltransferase